MQNVFWETLRMVKLEAAALTFTHMKWRTEMRLIQSESAKTIAGSRDLMGRVDALLTKDPWHKRHLLEPIEPTTRAEK